MTAADAAQDDLASRSSARQVDSQLVTVCQCGHPASDHGIAVTGEGPCYVEFRACPCPAFVARRPDDCICGRTEPYLRGRHCPIHRPAAVPDREGARRYHSEDCMDAHMLPCRCGADVEGATEQLAALLAAHRLKHGIRDLRAHCLCGWDSEPPTSGLALHAEKAHQTHVAAVIVAAYRLETR